MPTQHQIICPIITLMALKKFWGQTARSKPLAEMLLTWNTVRLVLFFLCFFWPVLPFREKQNLKRFS